MYYEDNIGDHVSISNYGTSEYECSGSCICLENDERRNLAISSSAVKRSLFFLVASMSSITAYKKAEEYFRKECVTYFSSTCSLSSISSKIDSCDKIKGKQKEEKDENLIKKEKRDIRRYKCKGNCFMNGNLKVEYTINKAREFGCENLVREGKVEVDSSGREYARNKFAKQNFVRQYLTEYCKKSSEETYVRESPSGYKKKYTFKKCVGSKKVRKVDGGTNYSGGFNPSVRCSQIFPKINKSESRTYWDAENFGHYGRFD